MQDTLSGYHCLSTNGGDHLGAGGFKSVRKECGKGDSVSNNGDLQEKNVSDIPHATVMCLLPCGSPGPRTSSQLHRPRSKYRLSCHCPQLPCISGQWQRLGLHGILPRQDGQCCFLDPRGQ